MSDITIAIVAHNAAPTIERAVRSACEAGDHPILLVDDRSSDNTAALAKAVAGDQICIVSTGSTGCVGKARQTAVEKISTPYGLWLDADDAIAPERPALMMDALITCSADLVFDNCLLKTAPGDPGTPLEIPDFIRGEGRAVRCLERNWFPALTGGFRTDFARKIGFDTSFECAEDYDFLVRAIIGGAEILSLNTISYVYFHGGGTISRKLEKTRQFVSRALAKHTMHDLDACLTHAGIQEPERSCILASNALYRDAPADALERLTSLEGTPTTMEQYGVPSTWFSTFLKASAHMMQAHWARANAKLEDLISGGEQPEVVNNLGVCRRMLGDEESAKALFARALELKPGYYDARLNREDPATAHFTRHPFRRHFDRDTY